MTRPSATRHIPNGKIGGEHLVGCGLLNRPGGSEWLMVEPAATAMRLMVAAAAADGVVLASSGTYRSYQGQVDMFTSRFSRRPNAKKSKKWDGLDWWPVGNFKTYSAATPGTSNHGKGLAADISRVKWDVRVTDHELRWLAAHGPDYGFWNTVNGEPFHWTYCLADDITPTVERGGGKTGTAPSPALDWAAIIAADAVFSAVPYAGVLRRGDTGQPVAAAQWKLASRGHDAAVNGTFDAVTETAVHEFQNVNGLPADGIVDVVAWTALGLPGGVGGTAPPLDGNPTPVVVDTPASGEATYVVQKSDGFERIAKRTLWSASKKAQQAIANANQLAIDATIFPLQHLTIPDCRFTVAGAGEGWDVIAQRLGHDTDTVRSANDWQPDAPRQGMVIYGGKA